jgi:hypothetical protein
MGEYAARPGTSFEVVLRGAARLRNSPYASEATISEAAS